MATTRVENNGDPQKLYEVLSGAGVISANSLSFDQFRNRVLNEEGFADTIYNAGRRSEQKGRLGEYHIEGETVGDFMQAYFPPVVKKKDTEDLSTLPTQESSAPGESLPADDGLFGAFPTQPLDIQEYDPETFEWDKYLTLIAASQGNLLSNEEFKDKLQQMGEQGDPLESFIYNLPGGIPAFGTNSSIKVTPQDDDTGTLGKIEYMSYLDDPSGKAVVYLNNAGLVRQTGLGSGAQIVSALTGDALVLEGFNPAEEADFEKLSVFVASAQKTNELLSIIDLHSDKAVGQEFREKRDELKARVGEVRRLRVGGRSGVPEPTRNRRTGRYVNRSGVGQEADERAGIRYEGRWQIDEYTESEYIDDVYQLRKEYQENIRNDYDARLRDAVLDFIPDPKGYQVVGDETREDSYAGAEARETGIISEELSGERNLYRQLDDYIFENTGAYIDLDGNGRLNEQFLVEDIARGFSAGAVDQVIAPIGYLATAGIDLFSSPFGGDFSLSRRLRLGSQNVSSYLREGMTYIPKGFTSSIASGDVYNATRLLTTQTAEAIPLIGTTLLSGGVANTFFGAGKIGMLATTTGTTAMLAGTSTYMSVKDNPNFSSDMDRFLYSLSAAGAESAQGLLLGHFQFKYMQNMRNLRSGAYGSVGRGLLNKSNTNIMIQNGLTPVVGALEEGSAYAMERYAYSAFTGEEIDPTEYRDGLIMSMSVGGVMGAGMDFVGNSGQRRQALVNSRYNRDFLIEVDGLSAIVEESQSYQQFKQDAIERLGEERGLSEAQIKKQELIVQMTGDILSNNQKKYSEFYSMMQVRHPEAMARLAELDLRIAYGEALLKDPMLGGTDGTASPDAVLVTSVIEPLVRERMAIEAEFAGETTTLTMAEQAQYNVNQNMDMLNSLIEEVDMSSASLAILKENVDQNPRDAQLQKLYDDAKQTHDALVGRKQEIIRLSEEAFALRTKLQEQTKSEAESTTEQSVDTRVVPDEARQKDTQHQQKHRKGSVYSSMEAIEMLFAENPELAALGTPEQYYHYIQGFFPDSKIKDIVYRGDKRNQKLEREDLDASQGTGAGNMGDGLYFAREKSLADEYAGPNGKTSAFIINAPDFHISNIKTNDNKFGSGAKSVAEYTGGSNTSVEFSFLNTDLLDLDNPASDYSGNYKGPVDDNGFPDASKDNAGYGVRKPSWHEVAVNSNEQIHVLGSQADVDAFKNFVAEDQSQTATKDNSEQVRSELEKVERQLAGVMGKPYSEVSTANLGADPTGPVDLRSDTERMNIALYGEQAQKMGYDPSERNAYQRFKDLALIKLQDKYRDLTVIQRDIESQRREKTGQGLPTDQNFLAAEETFYGKAANDLRLLEKSQDDIVKILRDNKIKVSELSEFMYAKHASERNRVARERENQKLVKLNEISSNRELTSQERAELVKIEKNLSNENFGSGMSDARANEILDGVPEGKRKAMEQAFNLTQDIIADTRKTMRDFNLESSQTIDAWESMFDNYTPLAGLAADESAGTLEYPTGGSGFQVYGSETMAITGRESLSQNLLAQVINQNAVTKMRARRNEVMITLYNMVDNNPNASMWRTSDTRPDQADLKRTGEGVVALKIDGKDKYVILKNKDLADKLKGYGTTQVAKWVRFVGAPSRVLRNLHTSYNPEFIITNYLRDIQHAVYSAAAESDVRGGVIDEASVRGIAVESSKNIKYLFRYNRNPNDARIPAEVKLYIDEFKANGAETGWSYLKDLETLQAELESATEQGKGKRAAEWMADNTYKFVEGINGAFENSIRLSAYIKARESGVDATTAAQFAKNITVNFNKSGEWTNTANSLYYFFNAGVQGSYRTARNLTTPRSEYRVDGSKREWYQRMTRTQKYAVGATAFGSLLTLFNQMTSEEDEESGMSYYQQIPHSIKSRNMIIMTGGESYISIPLPYGYGAIHAAAVNGTEVGLNLQDPSEAVWNTTDDVFNNFSPVTFSKSDNEAQKIIRTIAPDILDPLVDLSTNETYFGGKIYDERNVSSGDPARAYMAEEEVDPSVMKGFINDFTQILNETAGGSEMKSSGFFDWNPDIVEYLVEYYAGGTGRFIKDAGGAIIDIGEVTTNYLNGEPQDIVIDPSDIPFLRKVYGEADGKFYHLPTYYENRDKILELRNVLELDKEQGTNDFDSVFQEMFPEYQGDVEKGMIAVRQMVREYEDSFEVIKKSNRIIRNNRDRLENNEITDKEFYKIFNIQMDKKNKAYKNSNRLLYNLQLGLEPSFPYRIGEPSPKQTRMPEQSKYRR